MVTVAVSLNIIIALFCFYVAWRLWRLSQTLGAVADTLVNWERNTHNTLDPAVIPPAILLGQSGTAQLRSRYAQLHRQLRQVNQVLRLVGLLPVAGRWLGARRRAPGVRMTLSRKRPG